MKFIILTLSLMWIAGGISQAQDKGTTNPKHGGTYIDVAPLPESVRKDLAKIHAGMSRREVEETLEMNGGLTEGDAYYVRHFVSNSTKIVLIDIEFQPVNMPDAVYASEQLRNEWCRNHEWTKDWGRDIARKIGKPYLGDFHID